VKTTRYITFEDRVFEIRDLMRLANVLEGQVSGEPGRGVWTKCEVAFEDGHDIEGLAAEVFAEEELIRPSLPLKIDMALYSSSGAHISIHLRCGDSGLPYENSITISGDDAKWVNANYTTLEDALRKVPPQDFWWKRHRAVFVAIYALALACALEILGTIVSKVAAHLWHNSPDSFIGWFLNGGPLLSSGVLIPIVWVFLWVSFLPWAFDTSRRLFSMWPSIEFNFGSLHLRPDTRRKKLNTALTLVIIPIAIAVLIEIAKAAAT